MKGKISQRLEAVLSDPQGRRQLMGHLIDGRNGRIIAGDKTYALRVEVRKESVAHRKESVVHRRDGVVSGKKRP